MKYLASDPVYIQQFESIDTEKGIIKGVKICSEGEAKGHGVFLNKQFIKDVVKLGKEQTVGVKARFGHPNMCDTTLGTFIGRFKGFKTVGEENEGFEEYKKPRKSGNRLHATADLHLDETAKELPKLGNAWNYLSSLAETSPDMFGSSIVFHMGDVENLEWEDEDGNKQTRRDASIVSLLATDLVDSPAATDGLFSEFSTDEIAVQVTSFLDKHPEVYQLAVDNPEIVDKFMSRYTDYKDKKDNTDTDQNDNQIIDMNTKETKSMFEDLKNFIVSFFSKKEDGENAIPEEVQGQLNAFEAKLNEETDEDPQIAELQTQIDTITTERDTANQSLTESQATVTEHEAEITKLKGQGTEAGATAGKENDDIVEDPKRAEWNRVAAEMADQAFGPRK